MHNPDPILQNKIGKSGWAQLLLAQQRADGHWGIDYYRPKWACTHYTLLELKDLALPPSIPSITMIIDKMLDEQKAADGGISFWKGYKNSDICVDAMILSYASYFIGNTSALDTIIDLLLKSQMPDGGWNCRWLHKAIHSSFHTTQSVIEGIWDYLSCCGNYRSEDLRLAMGLGIEFLLLHHLFKSHRSLLPVDPKMLLFSYPPRWHYDVLRSLYFLAKTDTPYDPRMDSAIQLLLSKRNSDGTWNLNNHHKGKEFMRMEVVGKPSRWNSYRALVVLDKYGDSKT